MQEQSICQNGATITLRTGGQGRTTPSTHKKTNTNAASQMCVFILSTRLSWTEGPTRWTIVSCMLRDSTLSVIIPSVHQSVNRSHCRPDFRASPRARCSLSRSYEIIADTPHISGYPPKENQKYHFFWLCYLASGACQPLKKNKKQKNSSEIFSFIFFLVKMHF